MINDKVIRPTKVKVAKRWKNVLWFIIVNKINTRICCN
jgi:hypothetical protein